MYKSLAFLLGPLAWVNMAKAHIAFYDPSMWGFNVTAQSYSYDNRPMVPLMDLDFNQWWFHGHLDHPPNPGDLFELPAGKAAVSQLACNKGATKWWASSEGTTDIRQNDYPCPNSPLSAFHGIDDLKGCALAITYNSDVSTVQPEDFAVFSVNQTCVWMTSTEFQVPAAMPSCPPGGCICAWFWIHSVDSGSEQIYMNGFRCNVSGATGTNPVEKAQVARRCGADPSVNIVATPSNCTYGAKQPLYWYQNERNNMFEGQYSPPYYNDLYNFKDGAQDDIFQPGSVPSSSAFSLGSYSSSISYGARYYNTQPGSGSSSSTSSSRSDPSSISPGSLSPSSSAPYSSSVNYGSSSTSSSAEPYSSTADYLDDDCDEYSTSLAPSSSGLYSSYESSSTSSAEPYSSTTYYGDDDCEEYSTSLAPSQSSYSSTGAPHHSHSHSTATSSHEPPSLSSHAHSHSERKVQNGINKHYNRRIMHKNRNEH